jgi:hypothetical protein
MSAARKYPRVLALHLSGDGVSFCVFDAPCSLYDWGHKHIRRRDRDNQTLAVTRHLLHRFTPDAVVIEDTSAWGTRRSQRVCHLYREIEGLADEHAIDVFAYPWEAVFRAYAGGHPENRYEIAVLTAKVLPMIARRLPPKRRMWMPQDPRQSLFDAAALGITYFAAQQ